MSEPVSVSPFALQNFTARALEAAGVPAPQAQLVAECLLAANLRGIDSHGVHLLPYYIAHLRAGNLNPLAAGRVVTESGACLLYDGEHGLGQWISQNCCGHAVRLARAYGLGMVSVRRSSHFGIAAFWGQRIAREAMIGVVICNASPSVPPWQGKEGRVGTNPLCVAVPSTGAGAWLLDMATTTVALNRIVRAASNREPEIPAGWALDVEGRSTTSTADARWVTPLGGYKGSGLNLLVEILSGVISGGAMSLGVGGIHNLEKPMETSHMFLAIDVARFLAPDEFQARMEQLVKLIKSAAPAAGYDEILVAGEPETRMEATRQRGIPVDTATWTALLRLADEFGLDRPGR